MDVQEEISTNEKVEAYKARLIIKGLRQIQYVDYDDIFSLVDMLRSIQILLVITAHFGYEMWKMGVKTTFLNDDLEDMIVVLKEHLEVGTSAFSK